MPQSGTADGWTTYEDDWFRVSYPVGSEVAGAESGRQDPKSPMFGVIPPGGVEFGVNGAFTLQLDTKSKGMLLRDAIESERKGKPEDRRVALTSPAEVKVKNGRCLMAAYTWPFDRCEKDQGSCYAASIATLCDDFAGRRYRASTVLSRGRDPKAMSADAQKQAATYERILRSLEFKKS